MYRLFYECHLFMVQLTSVRGHLLLVVPAERGGVLPVCLHTEFATETDRIIWIMEK